MRDGGEREVTESRAASRGSWWGRGACWGSGSGRGARPKGRAAGGDGRLLGADLRAVGVRMVHVAGFGSYPLKSSHASLAREELEAFLTPAQLEELRRQAPAK